MICAIPFVIIGLVKGGGGGAPPFPPLGETLIKDHPVVKLTLEGHRTY